MEQKKNKIKALGSAALLLMVIVIIVVLFLIYKTGYLSKFIDFKLMGSAQITLELGDEYLEEGYTATTVNGKDLTDKVKIISSNVNINEVGEYKILYAFEMNSLNIHKYLYRTVKVIDNLPPELTVDSDEKITAYLDDKFKFPEYKAIDNYDGDITDKVKVQTNLDTSKLGTYEINYSVVDSNGNETTDTITVEVKRKKNPYVVVSISKQTLQYYEYGECVLTSNVVTGINGKTPIGTFKVLNKAQKIILKGADYESFVNYWIAFKGHSFGFHDASWRSRFGGTIYKTNGSHGCVNMPYAKVKQLYNLISIGTPVYIKA